MQVELIENMSSAVRTSFALLIAEKVFSIIDENDERYPEARKSLDKCWEWVESGNISGDELYELIDNDDYTGISEYAADEDDINIARLWFLLVNVVAYTSWEAYRKEDARFLPQSLEGIDEESIEIIMISAIETCFITPEEIEKIKTHLRKYTTKKGNEPINKDVFLSFLNEK